jgi:hypothetical protein
MGPDHDRGASILAPAPASVLGGVNLLSRDLVRMGYLHGQLGVPAIAELYAWALIGGAALLTRIGLRRPAVMLALLTAFYQCDLTLHTETCVYLGWVGAVAAGVWLVSFVAKLYVLGLAVRIRLSRSALVVPSFAALGMVVMPRYLRVVETSTASMLVGAWLFVVFASSLWTSRNVQSTDGLDAWGTTELRRSLRATWAMWAALSLLHVLFWCSEYGIPIGVLVPVALLLASRFVRGEAWVWVIVAVALVFVGHALPALLSFAAFLSAIVFGLHALRKPSYEQAEVAPPPVKTPYRTPECRAASQPRVSLSFGLASRASMLRLFAGALFATYLSLWTAGWSGGALPEHVLVLDLLLALGVVLFAWKLRLRAPVAALAVVCFHYAVRAGILGAPSTRLQWGILSVAIGFTLLIASLAASYRLRKLHSCPER